jgi:hypothetical protein
MVEPSPQVAAAAAAAMETTANVPVAAFSEDNATEELSEEPDDTDVVLGRGKRYQYHPGNLFFHGTNFLDGVRVCVLLACSANERLGFL